MTRIFTLVAFLCTFFLGTYAQNNALSFDGVDDHVDIGSVFTYQTFTIELWVKPGATQKQYAGIIDNNHAGTGSGQSWVLQQNDMNQNQYYFFLSGYFTHFSLTPNVWQHVAIVKTATQLTVYVNGNTVAASGFASSFQINYTDNFVRLGNYYGGGRNWNGSMDEVRFWDTPRTLEQIRQNMYNVDPGTTGLVAYYRMNEGSGQTISDITAPAINGTLGGSTAAEASDPTWVSSPLQIGSNSLFFDGVDDVASASSVANLPTGASPFTIETWIKTTSQGGSIIEWGTPNPNKLNGIAFNTSRGLIHYFWGNDLDIPLSAIPNFTNGQWHHVAVTYDGAARRIYVDGILVGADTPGAVDISNTAVSIGSSCCFDRFKGLMDELRIWNVARTAEQINQSLVFVNATSTGLVAYYKMNEGSGQTLSDATASASHGLLGSSTAAETSDPAWNFSPVQVAANSLSFDGVDDLVTVPDNSATDITGDITVEAYINIPAVQSGTRVVYVHNLSGGKYGYYLGVDNGKPYFTLMLPDFNINTAPTAISTNTWHHIAGVRSGGTSYLYVDGVLVNSQPASGPIDIGSGSGVIGNGNTGNAFGGKIDELRVWNVARTQTEVQNFRSKGLTGTETGLVALYNFNQGITGNDNTGFTLLPDLTSSANTGILTNFALTGTTSNFVAGAEGLTTLPLGFITFAASRQSGVVQLSWNTVNEQNMASFEIERSSNGKNFVSLGAVKAAGNSSAAQTYSFTDAQPFTSVNYYRLKSVELNGKQGYSQVVIVKMNGSVKLEVYPNPTQDVLQLQTSATGKLNFAIYNTAGVLIQRITRTASAGVTTLPINVSALSKGLYILQMESSTGIEKTSFIKQ